MSTKNNAFWANYAKEQKEKERLRALERERIDNEMKMRQAELNARIEIMYQKKQHKSALTTLYLVGLFGLILAGLVGYAKCEAYQRNEKPQTQISQ